VSAKLDVRVGLHRRQLPVRLRGRRRVQHRLPRRQLFGRLRPGCGVQPRLRRR